MSNKRSFKQILSLYPEINSYCSQIAIGDLTALDILNFDLSNEDFMKSLRECSACEVRDLNVALRSSITVNDIQYKSLKDFSTNFSIPDGDSRYFPFNVDDVMGKIKDAALIGIISDKIFANNCETLKKISQKVFDRSSMIIADRIGSSTISMDEMRADFETMVVEYTNKSDSFKIPKMVEIFHKEKNGNGELDKVLIDMVFPV